MSYEFYKILHVFSVIGFFAVAGQSLLMDSQKRSKSIKITVGLFTFLILVAGMGLLARIGHTHGTAFPTWAILKIVLWFLLAVFIPVASKRLPVEFRMPAFWIVLVVGLLAVVLAVLKPF